MSDTLALRYRPQKFEDLTGNENVAKVLRNSVSMNKLSNAYFFTGTRGSGKCFTPDQYVLTPEGYRLADSLRPKTSDIGYHNFKLPLINMHKEKEVTSEFYYNGKEEVYQIITASGYSAKVTRKHPLYIFDGKKFFWSYSSEMEVGKDYLCLPRNTLCFGNKYIVSQPHTEALAEFCGAILSAEVRDSELGVTLSWNFILPYNFRKRLLNFLSDFNKGVPIDVLIGKDTTVFTLKGNKIDFVNYFNTIFDTTTFNTEVPQFILGTSREVQNAFFRGLILTSGKITLRASDFLLSISNSSNTIIKQLQLLLLNMGILSKISLFYDSNINQLYNISFTGGKSFVDILFDFGVLTETERELHTNLFSGEKEFYVDKLNVPIKDFLSFFECKDAQIIRSFLAGKDEFDFISYDSLRALLQLSAEEKISISDDTKLILSNLLNDFFIDKIVVKYVKGVEETIDFTLPESHSFILGGIASHNTSSARIFAKALLCENLVDGEPCGKCDNCLDVVEGKHPDVIEIDAASENSVQGIRELIKSINYLPSRGKYKVVILDECHSLSTQASNAFLKTLEEPPSFVKFILCTTEGHKVLDTIKSRCLVFHFKDIQIKDVVKRLNYIATMEDILIDDAALEFIAKYSNGGMRDAVMLLEQASYSKDKGEMIKSSDIMKIIGFVSITDIQKLFVALKEGSVEDVIGWLDSNTFTPIDIVTSSINFLETMLYIKQGVSPSNFVSKDNISGVMTMASVLSFGEIVMVFSELKSIVYDLRNLSIVNTSTLFKFKMLSIFEKLHNPVEVSAAKGVKQEVAINFFKKFKEDFGLVRVPIQTLLKDN